MQISRRTPCRTRDTMATGKEILLSTLFPSARARYCYRERRELARKTPGRYRGKRKGAVFASRQDGREKRDRSFPAERRNQKAQLEHRRSLGPREKSSFRAEFIQAYFANQSTVHGSCDIDFLVIQQFRPVAHALCSFCVH